MWPNIRPWAYIESILSLANGTGKGAHSNSSVNSAVKLFMAAEQWSWKHPGELQHNNRQQQGALGWQHNRRGLDPRALGDLQQTTHNYSNRRGNMLYNKQCSRRKEKGLIPTQECGGPSTRTDGNGPQHRNTNGSKRRSIRSTCLNTQTEAEATNMRWKLCNVWGVEVRIHCLHGQEQKGQKTGLTDAELTAAAGTLEEAERWIQLANNLKHILISTILEQEARVISQSCSSQLSTTTTLRSLSQHGNLRSSAMSETTSHNVQTWSR